MRELGGGSQVVRPRGRERPDTYLCGHVRFEFDQLLATIFVLHLQQNIDHRLQSLESDGIRLMLQKASICDGRREAVESLCCVPVDRTKRAV